ncbi:MAG: hypothetical protein AAB592_05715 [Patescibacteria group bacterium]
MEDNQQSQAWQSTGEPYEMPHDAKADFSENDEVPVYYYCIGWFLLIAIIAGIAFGAWWFFLKDKIDLGGEGDGEPTVEEGMIGPEGGSVTDASGASVTVPEGALERSVKIEIVKVATGRVTDDYHLKPDGFEFKRPVTVSIPFKVSGLDYYEQPEDIYLLYRYNRYGNESEVITRADRSKRMVSTQVSRF